MPIALFVALGIGLVIVVAIFGHLGEKKRRDQMRGFAEDMGWSFSESGDYATTLERFDQFDRGHSRKTLNTMKGTVDHDELPCSLQTGDYRYRQTSGSGKNRRTSTHHFSYVALRLPFDHTPDLLVRRENFADRFSSVIGFDDIDFESEEFSRKFFVKSRDRKFAFALIEPRMMELLLDEDPPRIDVLDGYVLLTDGSRRWKPNEFREQLRFAKSFLDRWPAHLAADLST